jgi:hypothetical protein
MPRYVTRRIEGDALQWTGDNLGQIRDFAGEDFLFAEQGRVFVRITSGAWELLLGDWLWREEGKPLVVRSPASMERFCEPLAAAS